MVRWRATSFVESCGTGPAVKGDVLELVVSKGGSLEIRGERFNKVFKK